MKKGLLILLSLGLVLACSDDDKSEPEVIPTVDNSITISPVITRATRTDFEVGDRIGLAIRYSDRSYYVTNEPFTYDGELFVYSGNLSDGNLYWYADENPTEFFAYYPYSSTSVPETFTVATDQSDGGTKTLDTAPPDSEYTASGYADSDLITGYKAGVTEAYKSDGSSAPVSMSFAHQMTKILFSISNTTGSDISSVVVGGSIPTATVDYENASVEVDESVAPVDIKAQQVTSTTWRAIIVPQEVMLSVVVTLANGTAAEGWLATTDLVAGVQYGVSASVDSEGLTVNISDEYSDWDDDDVTVLQPGDPYLEEHLDENYIIYHGDVYKTATLSNGTTWMAQNMRYLPDGCVPTTDPTEGNVWYPYKLDYDQAVADGAVKTNLDTEYVINLTDEASIEELGYLYNMSVASGIEITADNYRTIEDVQGICPNGWHIPNRAEWFDLVGASNKNAGESANPANYGEAVLWDSDQGYATVGNAIAMIGYSFNGANYNGKFQTTVVYSGNSKTEEYYGELGLTYIWSSTCYQLNTSGVPQYFVDMSTFTSNGYPYGRQSLAYTVPASGCSLRCIRNHDIDFYEKHSNLVRPSDYEE